MKYVVYAGVAGEAGKRVGEPEEATEEVRAFETLVSEARSFISKNT